jgi:hypothetical protein
MLLVVPAADCELIVAAAELGSRDTRLSQPDRTGRLVGISLIKLYSNEVTGLSPGPLRRGGAIAATHWQGRGMETGVQDSNTKHTFY